MVCQDTLARATVFMLTKKYANETTTTKEGLNIHSNFVAQLTHTKKTKRLYETYEQTQKKNKANQPADKKKMKTK